MNKARRKQIEDTIEKLDLANLELTNAKDDEQEAYDNMPESPQESERGIDMESAIGDLEDAISELEGVIESLCDIVNNY